MNHEVMKQIQKIFFSGLITFLPIAITLYVIYVGLGIFENSIGSFIKQVVPPEQYIPGLGFLTSMVLIFCLGLLLNNFVTAGILNKVQEKLTEIPLIKVVYSPLRDLMNLFSKGQGSTLQKVVLVEVQPGKQILGLVTREKFEDLNIKQNFENKITVYIPMSYGLGGYTLLMDKSHVTPVDIPVEKAMSLALTAWIKADQQQK